ncbi:MAG: DNA-processing protein DprA [Candidatus Saccharibacteria bacterium]|nr:DNA-processing protein DprA [Candidatus Saccharibacteria bacterium]
MRINCIKPDKHKFFNKLASIFHAPEKLYYYGQLPEIKTPIIAIVGSRKPSTYGREIAYRLSYDLTKKGAIIVSGLALGIDAVAHKACLEAGGTTIAVLGSGLNHITPYTNRGLAQKIIEQNGAIISEYAPDMPALPHQFLERNRIVSGLADVIIVVEAAKRSGTLSTAAHALEQGREVGAVPGLITSPMSDGCHNLIKQGAHLITSADDIWSLLGLSVTQNINQQPQLSIISDPTQAKVLEIITSGINDGDQIIHKLNLTPDELNFALTMLEINGHITPLGANQWMRK